VSKKTLVIGASENPERYSYKAIHKLVKYGHQTLGLGLREGETAGVKFLTSKDEIIDLDSVSLYVSAKNQEPYKKYLIDLKPNRVIFNPGTENPELYPALEKSGIEVLEACTLVMLSIGNY
jgi:predicted CoA-binding protein